MTSSRFDLGLISKILNLFLLRFNERSGSENLGDKEQIVIYCFLYIMDGFLERCKGRLIGTNCSTIN